MYFRNYRLSITWLDNYLKSTVSVDPSTLNMLKALKHLRNLDERTFLIFLHDSEEKWFKKNLA